MTEERDLALEVIVRVLRDSAFASAVLNAELKKMPDLSPAAKSLATQMSYGTLRFIPWLEARLEESSKRGLDANLDLHIRCILLLAAYQIIFLDGVPSYAAVSSAVEQAKSRRGKKMAGFVNAVLRNITSRARKKDLRPNDPVSSDSVEQIAEKTCIQSWIIESWIKHLGKDEAVRLAASSNSIAPAVLRPAGKTTDRDSLIKFLEKGGVQDAEACRYSPIGVMVRDRHHPQVRRAVDSAVALWQDEGAQLAALALDTRSDDRLLDACAGMGSKTGIIASKVMEKGIVLAADINSRKNHMALKALQKQQMSGTCFITADLSSSNCFKPRIFNRILVDAPCTGDGTLRRRPDIRLRMSRKESDSVVRLQRDILEQCGKLLVPGGTMVYSVCSLLYEQGPAQAEWLLKKFPDFHAVPLNFASPLNKSRLVIGPHSHNTDGFFIASFRRE